MVDSNPGRMRKRRLSMLETGETAVASTGLLLAAILLLFMAAAAYFNVRGHVDAMRSARLGEIRAVGYSLRNTCRTLLALGDLSSVQRLMVESGRNHDLIECRVVLLDGRVVAHNDATQITTREFPETLPDAPLVTAGPSAMTGIVSYDYLLEVPDRGRARLHLTATTMPMNAQLWQRQSDVGIAGALALLALLLVYRRMRARLQSLGAIREALLSMGDGVSAEAVMISGDSPEAEAWNTLVSSQGTLKKQLMNRRVGEALSTVGRGGSRDLDSACDVMRQGLILVDRDGCVSYVNGAASAILQTPPDEIMKSPLTKLIADEGFVEALETVLAGRTRTWCSVEVEDSSDHAYCVLRYSVRPLRQDDASAAMVVINDVTQQRIAEETRNAFVAQVTHELRAPLTNIRLYAESAIEDGNVGSELQRTSLNVINQEARRLERIVGDMLSVAEIEAGKYEVRRDDVRLQTIFDDLKADFDPYANEKRIALDVELAPKLPVVQGDRDKIALAVHNLVGNAIKYTPQEGRVDVRVNPEGDNVVVEVSDSGIGIAEGECERVFEKFYRADDARVAEVTGSGLGLALAREVIRMHGGDITVDSKVDQGSTFVLTLPVLDEAA